MSQTYTTRNIDGLRLSAGMPVARTTGGRGVLLASCVLLSRAAVGLAVGDAEPSQPAVVQTVGVLELQNWNAATGFRELTPGSNYYLGYGDGQLSTAAANEPGQVYQLVGYALSETQMQILPLEPRVVSASGGVEPHGHAIDEIVSLQASLDGKVATNDSRLSDARTPTAHASSHRSGGSDAIKLDELSAPTDVTALNASISAHGLCPKLSGNAAQFLNGTGAFSTPAGGGGSGDTILLKASDQSISAAGFVDISGLTFPIGIGETYQFDAFVVYQSSATTMGVLLAINGPANSLFVARSSKQITIGGTASPDMFSNAILSAFNTPLPNSIAEPAQVVNMVWEVRGVITATASGTVALRFSKENVNGTATIKAGSFLRYRRLA